uniref:AAA+ ATPase domain-containing protein n=2 Tax=Dunaliella tertiolecta TaxID=3047 RepID=A0A7S3VK24_DUNTE
MNMLGVEEDTEKGVRRGPEEVAFECQTEDGSAEQSLITVTVEVRLKATSLLDPMDCGTLKEAVNRLIMERGCINYADGPLEFTPHETAEYQSHLQHVEGVTVMDTDHALYRIGGLLMAWQFRLAIFVYQVNEEEEPAEDEEGEDGVPSYSEWLLPAAQFEGTWASLHYESSIKMRLLRYATSALVFSDFNVNPHLVAWNRVVLLHGPPGTGKTSLCKALAQKLAIRFSNRYRAASLVEVNAHSLFSKWFSESGKQVGKLFSKITELLEEPDVLVFVLIDEVESLASARKGSGGVSEPSDAVRAVNALLTQLDALRRFPNAMVLTTSNITQAIDVAFVDRADIKAYIGPPSVAARFDIIRSSLLELCRVGIIHDSAAPLLWPYSKLYPFVGRLLPRHQAPPTAAACGRAVILPGGAQLVISQDPEPEDVSALKLSAALLGVAMAAEGLSGRSLRKLPFLAHALSEGGLACPCDCTDFLHALLHAAEHEHADRKSMYM